MRRTTTMTLGMVGVMALLALVLAVPAVAHRAYWPGWDEGATSSQVTADQAGAAAAGWLADNGYTDLVVAEIVDIDGHFYVVVKDAEGNGAFELFVSRNGSWVHPSPTMMWNTGYDLMATMMADMPHDQMMDAGTMSGNHQHSQHRSMGRGEMMYTDMTGMMDTATCQTMMGMSPAETLAEPLTINQATDAAQGWLDTNRAGAAATDPIAFPGYVTLRVTQDGTGKGLIAVQTTTGAIWPLQWGVHQ